MNSTTYRYFRRFLNWLFLILISTCSLAQSYQYEQVGSEDGLPQHTVNNVFQDSDGFIWLSSFSSLARFDGYSYVQLRANAEDSTSLPDGFIHSMLEDHDGFLWIGTNKGLARIDRKSGKCQRLPHLSPVKNWGVLNMALTDNKIWISSYQGLYVLEKSAGKWAIQAIPQLGIADNLNGMYADMPLMIIRKHSNNSVLIGYKQSLYIVEEDKLQPQKLSIGNTLNQDDFIFTITKLGENNYLIAQQFSGIYQWKNNQITKVKWGTGSRFDLKNRITFIEKDQNGGIWLGIAGAIWVWKNGDINQAIKVYDQSNVLRICMLKDGQVWIGTQDGLVKFNRVSRNFNFVPSSYKNKRYNVWGMAESKNRQKIFVGAHGGVFSLEHSTEQSWHFSNFCAIPNRSHSITTIAVNSHGVWLGGTNGLYLYNAEQNRIEDHFLPENRVPKRRFVLFDLAQLNATNLLLATNQGFYVFDCQTLTFNQELAAKFRTKHPKGLIFNLQVKDDGNIWATQNGLIQFDSVGNQLSEYLHNPEQQHGLKSNSILSVYEDHQRRVWAGSTNGLNMLDQATGKFKYYGKSLGLPHERIMGILADNQNKLWISTEGGLAQFNPETEKFNVFNSDYGLPFSEFSQCAYLKTSSDHMIFGGLDGLIIFHPDSIDTTPVQPQIKLSNLKINYESAVADKRYQFNYSPNQPLLLTSHDKVVTLEFSALNLEAPNRIQYQFMLEGYDEQWINRSSNERFATYTGLEPGNYTFKVRASDAFGNWIDQQLRVPIQVLPPIHKTWWFRLLVIVIGITVIGGSVRYYQKQKYEKRIRALELKHRLQQERERISRDLHDNVGAQLSQIVMSLDLLEHKATKVKATEIQEKAGLLSNTARDTVQLLRETIWALHKENHSLNEFTQKIRDYLFNFYRIANDPIQWEVTLIGDHTKKLPASHVLNLFRILQEATNNTAKYAAASKQHIKISLSPSNELLVEIGDDGKGFVLEHLSASGHFGLKNMTHRAKEIGGELKIHTKIGSGTVISIHIPTI